MAEMRRPVGKSEISDKIKSVRDPVQWKLPMSRPEIIIEIPEMASEEKPETFLPKLSVIQIVNKSAGSSCKIRTL